MNGAIEYLVGHATLWSTPWNCCRWWRNVTIEYPFIVRSARLVWEEIMKGDRGVPGDGDMPHPLCRNSEEEKQYKSLIAIQSEVQRIKRLSGRAGCTLAFALKRLGVSHKFKRIELYGVDFEEGRGDYLESDAALILPTLVEVGCEVVNACPSTSWSGVPVDPQPWSGG